jgi:Tfp pilus assembly protein PilV
MPARGSHGERGFSLFEALIASVLVGSVIVGLAHLVATAAAQSTSSRTAADALVAAQSKLEELRLAAWTYGPDAARVSSPALAESPPNALAADAAGYVDFLDAFGASVAAASEDVAFVRRWAVEIADAADADTLALHVCVFQRDARARVDATAVACVAGIRTRQP